MVLEKQIYTLDDLLAMGEDAHIEIAWGELIYLPVFSTLHQLIISNVFHVLSEYCHNTEIGLTITHGLGYLMNSNLDTLDNVFVPDVSFFSVGNVPKGWDIELPHPGAPDLAVEIVSPDDSATKLRRKIRTYLDTGTKQIWVVYPDTKEIIQHIAGGKEQLISYKGSQTIDAEALFPDIEGLTTDNIFKLPNWLCKTKEKIHENRNGQFSSGV